MAENVTESNKKADIKVEQERTRILKEEVVRLFPAYRGVIARVAKKLEINPKTIFEWRRLDPEFKAKLEGQMMDFRDEVRDALVDKILIDRDGPSIRYWLDRNDPDFLPKSKTELITPVGTKTAKELLDEMDEEIQKEYGNDTTTSEDGPTESNAEAQAGGNLPDKKQEGTTGPVPTEQGPGVLLEKADTPEPGSESPTKRDKQSHRRRPTPRQHAARH